LNFQQFGLILRAHHAVLDSVRNVECSVELKASAMLAL